MILAVVSAQMRCSEETSRRLLDEIQHRGTVEYNPTARVAQMSYVTQLPGAVVTADTVKVATFVKMAIEEAHRAPKPGDDDEALDVFEMQISVEQLVEVEGNLHRLGKMQ